MPKNAKELHSFLGLASYYHWFIPDFAHMAKCLHQLISLTNVKKSKSKKQEVKKEVTTLGQLEQTKPTFIWTSKHQMAFDTLKITLTTAPVLGYPDFTKEFTLETNALLKGLGDALSQQDNTSRVNVIAYASQTLRPSKQSMCNYSCAKSELLALKWIITKKFQDYLLGLKFPV